MNGRNVRLGIYVYFTANSLDISWYQVKCVSDLNIFCHYEHQNGEEQQNTGGHGHKHHRGSDDEMEFEMNKNVDVVFLKSTQSSCMIRFLLSRCEINSNQSNNYFDSDIDLTICCFELEEIAYGHADIFTMLC